jgi:hypothetical protein
MPFNRQDLIQANADFTLELNHTGVPRPVVVPEHDGKLVNAAGRDERDAQPRGIACRTCGCRDLRTLETRQLAGGKIFRRKACRHCGAKLTTHEKGYGT